MAYQSSALAALAALTALADPTRQLIVARLREGPLPVGRIADGLPVSRPAVSIHLRVLAQAGLVTFVSRGTRNLYSLNPDGLAALRSWLDDLLSSAPSQPVRSRSLTPSPTTVPPADAPPRPQSSRMTLLG